MKTARYLAILLAIAAMILAIVSIIPEFEQGRVIATNFALMSIVMSLISIADATNAIVRIAKREMYIVIHEVMEDIDALNDEPKTETNGN